VVNRLDEINELDRGKNVENFVLDARRLKLEAERKLLKEKEL
jgi:hypothetical protein